MKAPFSCLYCSAFYNKYYCEPQVFEKTKSGRLTIFKRACKCSPIEWINTIKKKYFPTRIVELALLSKFDKENYILKLFDDGENKDIEIYFADSKVHDSPIFYIENISIDKYISFDQIKVNDTIKKFLKMKNFR